RRRTPLFLVDVDRDATAVVGHRDRTVLVDAHHHLVGMAGEGLVDRVVDHREHHVVQAGAVVHVTDVHARALADGLETAQDGDLAGIVVALGAVAGGVVGHLRHQALVPGATRCRAATDTIDIGLETRIIASRTRRAGWPQVARWSAPCSTWNVATDGPSTTTSGRAVPLMKICAPDSCR